MSDSGANQRPPLIIIANDQEWSTRSLESILGPNGYAVLSATTVRQTLELARSTNPDLLIIDERMPDGRGSQLCRLLREEAELGAHVPILLSTAAGLDREARLAGFAAGAWDYVLEPVDAEALLLRVGNFVRAKRAVDRVREVSLLDPLTGLYNTRGLARRARELGAEAYRHRAPLACLALGPDAPVAEDTDGPELEAAVAHVGAVLQEASRASDIIGRVGRAEFAVLAPSTGEEGARQLARRLSAIVEATPRLDGGDREVVRLRTGVAAVADYAEAALDAEELLVRAVASIRDGRAGATL
jgi:diguanylate cyclase (GGDEF)-like protein